VGHKAQANVGVIGRGEGKNRTGGRSRAKLDRRKEKTSHPVATTIGGQNLKWIAQQGQLIFSKLDGAVQPATGLTPKRVKDWKTSV